MIKLDIITLGYCRVDMWQKCLDHLLATKSPETEWNYHFVYHYYPIDMENNYKELKEIAEKYNLKFIQPEKNLGGCEGWNWAWKNYLYDSPFIISIDPDSWPMQNGWDLALWQVAQDPRIGWAACKNIIASNNELAHRRHVDMKINNIDVHICDTPMMMAGVNILKMDWIRALGGQKQGNPFYGGVELCLWPYLIKANYRLALLKDFYDSTELQSSHDPLYIEWKVSHAFRGYRKNFDDYLKERQ